ncbi:hypothetical protein DFH08DRAFT_966613 [Mycena albidolilacea]|uniref:Uncharacterized protein n=1 Tax=Mycena albidolilacea TaxID=1033008 RepID=A0AAD7EL10_9AGAR|nr:hypothetical protein DFH08DRAFT_966613 [Mycena albidolilacea]
MTTLQAPRVRVPSLFLLAVVPYFSPAAGGITDQGNRVRRSSSELDSAQSDLSSESGRSDGFCVYSAFVSSDLDNLISGGLKMSKIIWLDPHLSSMVH